MKLRFTILLSASLFALVALATSCNKKTDDDSGVLASIASYLPVGMLTTTTAQVYNVVNTNGNQSVTAAGVCWSSTNKAPGISDSKTSNSIDSLSFASYITGLTAGTTYYVRGYITDNGGTAYGNVLTIKTNTSSYSLTGTVTTFAGSAGGTAGFVNGTATAAQFANPQGMCTDAQGNIYVADSFNSSIRKITPAGVVTTLAGTGVSGYADGPGTSAQFYSPTSVTADAQGNVFVADFGNNMIRKITSAGVVSTVAGRYTAGYLDATGTAAAFNAPTAVAADALGNVFVADQNNNVIRKITSAGVVTTFAGNASVGQVDSTGTLAYFNKPRALAFDAQGNLFVVDGGNYSLRKITTAGVVKTVVGNYLLKQQIFTPNGICIDSKGDIFIANGLGRVLEITTANTLISLAGSNNVTGFANGTNMAALFNGPQSVALDAQGNVLVSDYYNNMIRKIVVTTTP